MKFINIHVYIMMEHIILRFIRPKYGSFNQTKQLIHTCCRVNSMLSGRIQKELTFWSADIKRLQNSYL